MSDENERSVASDGVGSGLPKRLLAPEWRDRAQAMTFYGISVSELSRDELLSVVGYMANQAAIERERHASKLGVMRAAASPSNRRHTAATREAG